MDDPGSRFGFNRPAISDENPLKYAAGSAEHDAGSSDSASNDSVTETESTQLADLSASFRIFSEWLLRKDLAEQEMFKSREALRCEAEKRRMESDAELTQMLVQTQLQIASLAAGMNPSRKRKRGEEDESPVSQRERALLLSLLQCNFII